MIRNCRKAFLVSVALLGGTLLMTACNQSDADSSSGKADASVAASKSGATGVSGASASPSGSGNTSGGSTSGSGKTSGGSTSGGKTSGSGNTSGGSTSGSGSTSDSGETVVEGLNKGKGVSGTWYGIVRYVAPGKYLVDGPAAKGSGGEQQAFFLAEDTVILGGGQICGTAGSKVDAPCEEADLEKAAKKGVEAEVVVKNGTATQITDGALL
ncbi:hypothetical protein PYK79_49555 [Streptomyces sp. ID05-04B]|uniref:hypothetical protein n=1 Tax=unclassified Streptomyces TaxID=2593676 RepID=UPI000D1B282D|nr:MULTISPECIES: hypothetical protein [unclassified Streptomyces]AVV41547.1 hypothetical protein C6376_08985 [Streptomyces sp. P3]MDX5569737.1 hypothetical protein [Streptomyces sp. ID05-04B]